MNQHNHVTELIKIKVAEGVSVMAPHLQKWLRTHLVDPRPLRIATDPEGKFLKEFWLVTDHVGDEDASCRIVYDEHDQVFGLESTLDTGVEWYMDSYGSFSDTVENM